MLPHRFLVIDDNLSVRARVRWALEEAFPAATILEAGSAEDALAFGRAPGCSLIVVDVCLPGRNGLQAVPELHALHPGVPIVVVASASSEAYTVAALRAGADAFVSKQHFPQTLMSTVRRLTTGAE